MIKKFIKRVISMALGKSKKSRKSGSCEAIPYKVHGVKREGISSAARRVTDGLQAAGFQAYVVGGAVRDLLLKRQPKDFDIATDATPEEVRRIFRRSRIIGRRFRLVHVMFGDETVEVSTFRRMIDAVDAQGITKISDLCGNNMRTSTPRSAASFKCRSRKLSGTKYALVIQIRFLALAIRRNKFLYKIRRR